MASAILFQYKLSLKGDRFQRKMSLKEAGMLRRDDQHAPSRELQLGADWRLSASQRGNPLPPLTRLTTASADRRRGADPLRGE